LLRRLHDTHAPGTTAFLFTGHGARPHSPSHLSHLFPRLVNQADLPPIRFHDLRHGAASLSLAAGYDLKTVQALLGHHSIACTVDTYASVLPSLARHAAEATAALLTHPIRHTGAPARRQARRLKPIRKQRRHGLDVRPHGHAGDRR